MCSSPHPHPGCRGPRGGRVCWTLTAILTHVHRGGLQFIIFDEGFFPQWYWICVIQIGDIGKRCFPSWNVRTGRQRPMSTKQDSSWPGSAVLAPLASDITIKVLAWAEIGPWEGFREGQNARGLIPGNTRWSLTYCVTLQGKMVPMKTNKSYPRGTSCQPRLVELQNLPLSCRYMLMFDICRT